VLQGPRAASARPGRWSTGAPPAPLSRPLRPPLRFGPVRCEKGLTQQALSDTTGIHVTQIRRYEASKAEPTLEIRRKLARGLGVPRDALLFDTDERGPQRESIRLRLEAIDRLDDDELKVLEEVVDGILLKHDAKRWTRTA
jgi:transcriptional regulator with XRE-family HTH domain